MAPTHDHYHPSLGRMTGVVITHSIIAEDAKVVQFRSVPYAKIPARFQQASLLTAIPLTYDHRSHQDFSKYGSVCPQSPRALVPAAYGGLLPNDLDGPSYDEFACLNLTISVPERAVLPAEQSTKPLPVMAYLHGGAFAEGTGATTGFHDCSRMVSLSIRDRTPVIAVAINYRVGLLGNLASYSLQDEALKSGLDGNTSLHDQRLGLRWINRFIAGFGGDPNNVTCFGQSAGGISVFLHTCSDEPLFKRAIAQSGLAGAGWPSLESWEKRYQRLLQHLEITEEIGDNRLEALRNGPAETLVMAGQQLRMYPTYPYLDPTDSMWKTNGVPSCSTANDLIRNCGWCEEIMVGDMANEGFMFGFLVSRMTKKALKSHFQAVLGPDLAANLLESYGIRLDTNDATFYRQAALMFGDLAISEPVDSLYYSLSQDLYKPDEVKEGPKIFRYHFDLPCPIPNALHDGIEGRPAVDFPAAHGVDLMYLLLTLLERYPEVEQKALTQIAYDMARSWISFANGQGPSPSQGQSWKDGLLLANMQQGLHMASAPQNQGQFSEGLSRPTLWQTIRDVYTGVATDASYSNSDDKASNRINQTRTALLDFGSILQKSA